MERIQSTTIKGWVEGKRPENRARGKKERFVSERQTRGWRKLRIRIDCDEVDRHQWRYDV
jgi:hypothetical protein